MELDYKKLYEELVQRARELHKGGNALTKQQMEIVCPELAESEDKRVNEEIRNFLIDMECKREWISYLEKQKINTDGDFARGYDCGYECCLNSHGAEWFEKQKEQKPAEWSEEDADILNCCISSIEEAKENRYAYKETDGDTSYDREINWLKSLRPQSHWKPSEEQMGSLRLAIDSANKAQMNATANTLNEIYEQLKKLM